MVVDHPVTGVGLASFGPAFPFYSLEKPREAHNTFLQIAAESGLIAGIVFLLIYVYSIAGLWSNGNRLRQQDPGTKQSFLFLANEATLVAFCGLLVCSLFLSLQMFEVFYCLFVLVNSILFLSRTGATQESMGPTPARSGRRRGRRGRGSWNSSVGMTQNRDKHGNPWNS
jgi:O-antigen ligase